MHDGTDRAPARRRGTLLLGPTGAGKTPLGRIIEQRGIWGAEYVHFDFGDQLREVVARDQPDEMLGRDDILFLRDVLQSGALLENEHFPLAQRILLSFLAGHGAHGGAHVLLNGLPRHVGQAEAVDTILDVEAVVFLKCPTETVIARIRSDVGGDRADRVDDDLGAVRDKLEVFRQRTAPLLDHYRSRSARMEILEVTPAMTAERTWDVLSRRGRHEHSR